MTSHCQPINILGVNPTITPIKRAVRYSPKVYSCRVFGLRLFHTQENIRSGWTAPDALRLLSFERVPFSIVHCLAYPVGRCWEMSTCVVCVCL